MPLLHVSSGRLDPTAINLEGSAEQRTSTMICAAAPAGAVADVTYTVRPGGAIFEAPVSGTTIGPKRITVPATGLVQEMVTLAKVPGTTHLFAVVDAVLTEVATPGQLSAPPQSVSAIIRIR